MIISRKLEGLHFHVALLPLIAGIIKTAYVAVVFGFEWITSGLVFIEAIAITTLALLLWVHLPIELKGGSKKESEIK